MYYMICLQFLRESIRAEVEGRSYTPPAPSSVAGATPSSHRGSAGNSQANSRVQSRQNLAGDDWGDWGDSKQKSSSPGAQGSKVGAGAVKTFHPWIPFLILCFLISLDIL